MNLTEQAVIVTGAGSGMGNATARALACRGAQIAALDLDVDAVCRLVGEIGGLGVECDVSNESSAV